MKIINIDEQVLDQMNRHIDFAYFLAGTMVALALAVVVIQLVINRTTINSIRKENKELMTETLRPLLVSQLSSVRDVLSIDDFECFEDLVVLVKEHYSNDSEVTNLIFLRCMALRSKMIRDLASDFAEAGVSEAAVYLSNSEQQNLKVSISDLSDVRDRYCQCATKNSYVLDLFTKSIERIKQLDKIIINYK